MPPVARSMPQILPTSCALDDLELLRLGVSDLGDQGVTTGHLRVPLGASAHPGEVVEVIDPEGTPLARVTVHRRSDEELDLEPVRWLAPRPERPFETHHRSVPDVPAADRVVLVDRPVAAADLVAGLGPDDTLLVVVAASVERDAAAVPAAVRVCRSIASTVDELTDPVYAVGPVNWVIAPIAADHPQRARRIAACATAYGRGGELLDLTGGTSPAHDLTGSPADGAAADGGAGTGGAVLFFTGLSGSGKSTLARAVRNRLLERTEATVTLLDGDVVRRHLSTGLGFSAADRDTNIRRIGWVAAQIAQHGGLAICSPIAPFEATRRDVRAMVTEAGGRFVLIHVATPLAECERRDRKGLYARARRGEIPEFTGISSPYEEPVGPDLRVDTTGRDVDMLIEDIVQLGADSGLWDL